MNPEDIAKDMQEAQDQSNEQIVADLKNLRDNAGWQQVIRFYEGKIEVLQKEILESEVDGEELNRLRDKRNMSIQFKNLPDILIGAITNPDITTELPEYDPYDDSLKPDEE